jgi:hypothetical protein
MRPKVKFFCKLDSDTVENSSYDAGLQNNRYIDDDDDEAEEDFDDQVDEDEDENDIDELSDEFPTDSRFTAHHLIQVSLLLPLPNQDQECVALIAV